MTSLDIRHQRLINQQVTHHFSTQPHEVVARMGAVQAQDYLAALWAVGLRARSANEQQIEQALADKTIVRTWPMRGTLHFVAAADVRWMLELLTPRVVAARQRRLQQLGLDDQVISRSADVITKALQGGKQLARTELYHLLQQNNIPTDGQRGIHILGSLAHDQLLCFGAREGKQPTFTLLDEWVPHAQVMQRDEALATLAQRYFTGHGPATLYDFMWWSGLTAHDARVGLETATPQLGHEARGNVDYYFADELPAHQDAPTAYLLPAFDEYLVGYKDRSAVIDPAHMIHVNPGSNGVFSPIVVINGRVAGVWKRAFKKDTVTLTIRSFRSFADAEIEAVKTAAEQYARFVGYSPVIAMA